MIYFINFRAKKKLNICIECSYQLFCRIYSLIIYYSREYFHTKFITEYKISNIAWIYSEHNSCHHNGDKIDYLYFLKSSEHSFLINNWGDYCSKIVTSFKLLLTQSRSWMEGVSGDGRWWLISPLSFNDPIKLGI